MADDDPQQKRREAALKRAQTMGKENLRQAALEAARNGELVLLGNDRLGWARG